MDNSGVSERFRNRLAVELELMRGIVCAPATQLLGSNAITRVAYVEYLIRLHQIVRASVPLMEIAVATLCLQRESTDPLILYIRAHIDEELRHDIWLLEDLAVIGVDEDDVYSKVPSDAVRALVGSQYYWIHHDDPCAVLGYIAALEYFPPSSAVISDVISRCGLPHAAGRTLLYHASADHQHCADLLEALQRIPLSSRQEMIISMNARTVIRLCGEVIADLVSVHAI